MAVTTITDVDRGDVVEITTTWRNDAGVLTDPTTVTYTVRTAGGSTDGTDYVYGTDAEVTKSATGIFVLALPIEDDVTHVVRWVGTGAVEAAGLARISVQRDGFS
jgi:hypothetical protein